MKMNMSDSLSSFCAAVVNNPETLFCHTFGLCQLFRHHKAVGDYVPVILINLIKGGYMLLRHYQYMYRCFWVYVIYGYHFVILIYYVSGYLTGDNFTEYTI